MHSIVHSKCTVQLYVNACRKGHFQENFVSGFFRQTAPPTLLINVAYNVCSFEFAEIYSNVEVQPAR
jgi:hypothetical protein